MSFYTFLGIFLIVPLLSVTGIMAVYERVPSQVLFVALLVAGSFWLISPQQASAVLHSASSCTAVLRIVLTHRKNPGFVVFNRASTSLSPALSGFYLRLLREGHGPVRLEREVIAIADLDSIA